MLADGFLAPEAVREIVAHRRSDDLEPAEIALIELADTVARDATSISQADIDRLRDLGLSDADIFDVVAAAAARCFFSKTLDALGAQADAAYAALEPELRDALTVGRPIANDVKTSHSR